MTDYIDEPYDYTATHAVGWDGQIVSIIAGERLDAGAYVKPGPHGTLVSCLKDDINRLGLCLQQCEPGRPVSVLIRDVFDDNEPFRAETTLKVQARNPWSTLFLSALMGVLGLILMHPTANVFLIVAGVILLKFSTIIWWDAIEDNR